MYVCGKHVEENARRKEALANLETLILDFEPQSPNLTFILMDSTMNDELMEKCPSEVGAKGKKCLVNSDKKRVKREGREPS